MPYPSPKELEVFNAGVKIFATEVLDQLGGDDFLQVLHNPTLTIDTNIWKRNHLLITLPAEFVANPALCDGTVNNILITFDPVIDLYILTFYYTKGCGWIQVAKKEGIYCDMLAAIITKYAGLKVTLPEVNMDDFCGFTDSGWAE